jgi:retron-type reverse transcriptase
MEMTVADLQLGDEFLYSVQGTIARAKVIRPVAQKKVQPPYRLNNKVYYKSVKCKVAMIEKSYVNNWNGTTRTWTTKEYTASDNYTVEKFVNLNHRNVWLIKRED